MELFVLIAIICLLLTFSGDIVKQLRIAKLFTTSTNAPSSEEQQKLDEARAELRRIRATPTVSEYVQTILTMRAEKKVHELQEKLYHNTQVTNFKRSSIELFANYGIKAVLSLCLLVISIRNRYTPVAIFGGGFVLKPLGAMMSFPTGVANSISVPMWIFCCNCALRWLHSTIKIKH